MVFCRRVPIDTKFFFENKISGVYDYFYFVLAFNWNEWIGHVSLDANS